MQNKGFLSLVSLMHLQKLLYSYILFFGIQWDIHSVTYTLIVSEGLKYPEAKIRSKCINRFKSQCIVKLYDLVWNSWELNFEALADLRTYLLDWKDEKSTLKKILQSSLSLLSTSWAQICIKLGNLAIIFTKLEADFFLCIKLSWKNP